MIHFVTGRQYTYQRVNIVYDNNVYILKLFMKYLNKLFRKMQIF